MYPRPGLPAGSSRWSMKPRCSVRAGCKTVVHWKEKCMRRIVVSMLAFIIAPLMAQSSAYRVTHTYPLGGDGGWDYIVPEPAQHRIFIGRTNRVMVVDENDGKLLGEVM